MADMAYRTLGRSGLFVSVVGLGCNNFGTKLGVEETRPVIDCALDVGITFLDTADSYGESESVVGEALGQNRDRVVLATKFGTDLSSPMAAPLPGGGSRGYIRRAVERSLRRLRTDYIDLYQLHWSDPATPIEETLDTLDDLIREGKVRYAGCSNLPAWQVAEAALTARILGLRAPFVSAQNYYNLLDRDVEADLVPVCERYGLSVLPYFPLANGLLAGRYRRGEAVQLDSRLDRWGWQAYLTDRRFDVAERLEAYAAERARSILDVAIAGLAAQPGVASVIAGVSSIEQVRANAQAGSWAMSAEDLSVLDQIAPSRKPGHWRHPVAP